MLKLTSPPRLRGPRRYAHLATGPWETSFLSNSDYVNWLDSFASTDPIRPHERLVDYVRQRLPQTQSSVAHRPQAAFTTATSSSSLSNFATAPAPFAPFSLLTSGISRHTMNGSTDVDFSDLIDYSALGDDNEASASYAAALDHSFDSTSHSTDEGGRAGTATSASLLPGVNAGYPPYSAGPNSSSTISGYPPSSSAYPTSSSSASPSGLVYGSMNNPYEVVHQPSNPYYSSTPSLDPSSFFNSQPPNHPSTSSTLAMQSQLIQDERKRRLAAASAAPSAVQPSFVNPIPTASAVGAQPSAATTISPSMMLHAQNSPATSTVTTQPVASSSRTASPVVEIPVRKKSTSSTSAASKARASTSTAAASSSVSTSVKRWNKVLPDVRANLSANRLQKAPTAAAQKLLHLLSPFQHVGGPSSTLSDWSDGSDIPPEGRKEILTDLLKYAGDDFWQAWVREGDLSSSNSAQSSSSSSSSAASKGVSLGIELLSFWFEGASKSFEAKKEKMKEKDNGTDDAERKRRAVEQMTLVLVLQVFAKLPVTFRHLSALGSVAKRVRKITLKGDEAVKAAATRLYDRWKKVQDDYNSSQAAASATKSNGGTNSSASSSKERGPLKKAKTATGTATNSAASTTTAKKAPTTFPPVSTNKVTANLSFKKKADPVTPPTTMNAMRAALAKVKKTDGSSAASSGASKPTTGGTDVTPTATSTATTGASTATHGGTELLGKNGKPKKSVRWKPDEELEAIKYIKKAIYDDDETGGDFGLRLGEGEEAEENFREMEQQEGLSLTLHLEEDEEMEEEIDWYEPFGVVIPDTEDFASLRQEPDSNEFRVQTERESQLMAIDPESLANVDSPNEPAVPDLTSVEPEPESKVIPLSADLASDPKVLAEISAAQAASVPLGGFAANDQIESLLGQLNTSALLPPPPPSASSAAPPAAMAVPENVIDPATLEALKGYDVDQIRQILDTQPAFRGMTVENLGLANAHAQDEVAGSTPGGAGGYPPNVGQGYNENAHAPPYGSSWGQPNYGTPWQPSAPPVDAYNGYVPPSAHGSYGQMHGGNAGGGGLPSQKAALKKGKKRKTLPCKYFQTSRGCDWGDKCSFIHDSS
ncbi:hypothetical protein JCM3766R1_003575 [Sporobolomyces carnicolor]